MAVTKAYTLYAVQMDPATTANAVFIKQIENFVCDPRLSELLRGSDGMVDPTYVATMASDPRMSFTTSMLATLLAEASSTFLLNGLLIDADVSHDGLEAWFQATVKGGTRNTGDTHMKMTVKSGMLLPRVLRVAHNQLATMDLEVVTLYDGTNDPIVMDTTAATEGTPGVSEAFTLGPITLNGTAVDGVQDLSIDPGVQELVRGSDGQVWPTYAAIMGRSPRITFTCLDPTMLATYGLTGTVQSATDSTFYLRKVTKGGTRVADATAEHIKFTVDDGQIRVLPIRGSHGDVVGVQCEVRPIYDGSNGIIVVSAASAIT